MALEDVVRAYSHIVYRAHQRQRANREERLSYLWVKAYGFQVVPGGLSWAFD
jgi:hypothetical protein